MKMTFLKKGDLVKHQYDTMQGTGIVLRLMAMATQAKILWTNPYGQTVIHEAVATRYLEVINESR